MWDRIFNMQSQQKIRLIQHLCPSRHCVMATAYAAPTGEEDPQQVERLKAMEQELQIDPWCGLCGSKQLFYEDRPTIFKTIEQSRIWLRQAEAAQAATRAWWKASKS
jgi:hypothetical protein